MRPKVYFTPVDSSTTTEQTQRASKQLLHTIIEQEGIQLQPMVPLKVHFGEAKNVTFIKPENYLGVIEYLNEHGIDSSYMETCVLYGGKRYKRELHQQTAEEHGFTQLPIIFADGEAGEEFAEVRIDKKHFETFKIGRAFLDYEQLIVLSHFKGHTLAGFGGAIKQLSMGYASKGGKLAMHMDVKPHIKKRKCTQCERCKKRCTVDALDIGDKSRIDHEKCVGCGACVATCPEKAISIFSFKSLTRFIGIGNPFVEKVVEGAYAAQLGRRNIYLNFAMNITKRCDCEPKRLKTIMDDIGIFASTDPVAIDKACWDMVRQRGKKFRGRKAFTYAEAIGLGSPDYELQEVEPASEPVRDVA